MGKTTRLLVPLLILTASGTALAASGTLAYTNGRSVTLVGGAPGVLYVEDGYAKFEKNGNAYALSYPATALTLGANGDTLLAVYSRGPSLLARSSTDGGGSWRSEVTVASGLSSYRNPTACVWTEGGVVRAAVAWSNGVGVGAGLYAATMVGGVWSAAARVERTPATLEATAPSLACDRNGATLFYRESGYDADGYQYSSVRMTTLNSATGAWSSPVEVVADPAYDPSACRSGNTYIVGYHGDGGAHIAISNDAGSTWRTTTLDSTGRFVSVDCSGVTAVASWADYSEITAPEDDARRTVGLAWTTNGGRLWSQEDPAGGATHQILATVKASQGSVVVVWRDSQTDEIHTAEYP